MNNKNDKVEEQTPASPLNNCSLYKYWHGFPTGVTKTVKIISTIFALLASILFYVEILYKTPQLVVSSSKADKNDLLANPFEIKNTSSLLTMKYVGAACLMPHGILTPDGILMPQLAERLGDIAPGDSVFYDCGKIGELDDPHVRKKFKAFPTQDYAIPDSAIIIGIEWKTLFIRRAKTWVLSIKQPANGPEYWIIKSISHDRLFLLDDLKASECQSIPGYDVQSASPPEP